MSTSSFIHRATVERNSETGSDAHGNPLVATYAALSTLDCRVYNDTKANVIDGDKSTTIEVIKIAWRLTDDLIEGDRITGVTDRNSVSIYSANFIVKEKKFKYDHYEAILEVAET